MVNFLGDTFRNFLEEEPRTAYFSFQDQFGPSQTQQNFFRNQFQKFHNQFMGNLGSQIRSGEPPTLRFEDFLGGLDFGQEFARTDPFMRGGPRTSLFRPRTRSIFF